MKIHAGISLLVALIVSTALIAVAETPEKPAPYPEMAPVEQYLMADRNAEIAMARSAAPDAISRDATILVLGARGFETAVEGKDGFVCMVERAWVGGFDRPEYWNPKVRGPDCLNPEAARSMLPIIKKVSELVMSRHSRTEIVTAMKIAIEKKEFPVLETGAMSYMMSKAAYLTDEDDHNGSHLMFYLPLTETKDWGASVPNSPVGFGSYWVMDQAHSQFKDAPPIMIFTVQLGVWSDGTAAPSM